MQIEVNGEGRQIDGQITVAALLQLLGVAGGPVAVERNRQIVPRADGPPPRRQRSISIRF